MDGPFSFAATTEVGVASTALFQPPKSSSAIILGGACTLPPPNPEADDDEIPPHAKSLEVVRPAEDLAFLGCADALVEIGSGVAQASLEPQASAAEKLGKALDAAGAGFGTI